MSGINLTTIEEINQNKALIIPAHYNAHYNQAKILWAIGAGSAGIVAFVLFFQNLALRSKAKSIASKSWEVTKKPFVYIWENYIDSLSRIERMIDALNTSMTNSFQILSDSIKIWREESKRFDDISAELHKQRDELCRKKQEAQNPEAQAENMGDALLKMHEVGQLGDQVIEKSYEVCDLLLQELYPAECSLTAKKYLNHFKRKQKENELKRKKSEITEEEFNKTKAEIEKNIKICQERFDKHEKEENRIRKIREEKQKELEPIDKEYKTKREEYHPIIKDFHRKNEELRNGLVPSLFDEEIMKIDIKIMENWRDRWIASREHNKKTHELLEANRYIDPVNKDNDDGLKEKDSNANELDEGDSFSDKQIAEIEKQIAWYRLRLNGDITKEEFKRGEEALSTSVENFSLENPVYGREESVG